jgi:hypothetical protein
MADGVEQLQAELAGLLMLHEPTLSDGERADLVLLEERCGWRPGSRPTRPERKVSAFLDFFDRAEQQELTDRTLAGGSVDALRLAFRERLAAGRR